MEYTNPTPVIIGTNLQLQKGKVKLSKKSKLLVFLGKTFYGSPESWGIDCTAEEFYCLPSERPLINRVTLHHTNVQHQESMKRNLMVDIFRRKAQKDIAIAATILSLSVFMATTGVSFAWTKGKQAYNSTTQYVSQSYKKMNMSETEKLQARQDEIKEEVAQLEQKLNNGEITKEQWREKLNQYNVEFGNNKKQLDATDPVKIEEEKKRAEAEAQAKVQAEQQAKLQEEAKLKADQEAQARAQEQAQADADAKVRAEAEARLKAEQEAKAKQVKVEAPKPVVKVEQPKPVAKVEPPKPVEQPKPVAPAKPKMSDSEKQSLKSRYTSQFQNGEISREEMISKIKALNN